LFGRVSRKKFPALIQKLQKKLIKKKKIQLSDTPGTLKGTWFCGQRKQKKCFLAANQPDGFGAKRDKKHPMPKVKYNAGSLLLWAFFFFAGGPGHLVQIHGIIDSIKYKKIKT